VNEAFDSLAGGLDYPMFIVTAAARGERDGCLVGFATQAGIDPPHFIVCLSKNNRTYRIAKHASAVAVQVVPEDGGELAELFGGETADEVGKLERAAWSEGPEGLPLLEGCPSWFAGRVLERIDCGDHEGLLLEVFAAADGGGGQFSVQRAVGIEPGHEA
jgi:flavin reductase (DIM6/NTAB) family NADH-FMN oxidoreductase RutF